MHLYSYLFALSVASIANARIKSSPSSQGLCDPHELDSLLNPVCYGTRRSSTSLDLQCLQEGLCFRSSQSPIQQFTFSTPNVKSHPEWSHKPRCIRQENSTEAYCVYTSPTFARGRGISIWTTLDDIEAFLKLPAFRNQSIFDGVNEEPNPPYIAKELPGRGIGLVANRTLHRGDRIFSHTPVFLIQQEVFQTFDMEDRIPMQRTAIQRLPWKAKSAFMALCGHFGGDHIEDVINTNSFAVDMWAQDSDTEYNAIFPEISRLNHDCRPNAHYYFDPHTLTQHVHALHTIHPGEELTISYIDPAQDRTARQHSLHESWGFHCTCSLCTQSAGQVSASDARLAQIAALRADLEDYSPDSEACPAMAELLVSLYEQERMWGPIAEAYTLAALEYNGVGDAWGAQRYARLAVEAGLVYAGPHDEDVRVMQELLRDPWGHWSWMLRVTKRMVGRRSLKVEEAVEDW